MSAPSNLTAWERWELASFDEDKKILAAVHPRAASPGEKNFAVRLPTATEIEQIMHQAHAEGFAKGKEEGYRAGFAEGQSRPLAEARRLAGAANKLERALGDLESTVADDLLALAIELARAVLRQELTARPETLLNVVHEALEQLPHQHAAIYLNPEDAALLRSLLGDHLTHGGHRLHEDPSLARGDCILEAGGTQVDATVAMRWRRVLEGLGIVSAWQPDTPPGTTADAAPTDES